MGEGVTASEPPAWRWGCAVWLYGVALAFFALLATWLTDNLDPGDVLGMALFVVLVPLLIAVGTAVTRGRNRAVNVVVLAAFIVVGGSMAKAHWFGPDASRVHLEALRVPASLEFDSASEVTTIGDNAVSFTRYYNYRGDDPVGMLIEVETALTNSGYRRVTLDADPSNFGPYGPGLSLNVEGRDGSIQVRVSDQQHNTRYRVTISLTP